MKNHICRDVKRPMAVMYFNTSSLEKMGANQIMRAARNIKVSYKAGEADFIRLDININ